MLEEIKKIKSSKKNLRSFGLFVGGIFIILSLYFYWRNKSYADDVIYIGIILVSLGAVSPLLLKPLQKTWMTLGIMLGFLVTNIILMLFFYLVITPFSFIARLVGKSFLDTSFGESTPTYWKKREEKKISKVDMEKQF
ncbi:MAG TPA: SxtJ family membrane protein [Candidatus Paceibacterota bacterium]